MSVSLRDALRQSRRKLTSGTALKASVLLSKARKQDPDITLDELSAARLIASEHSSGTVEEWACIVDAELNRAERRGRTLTAHLTGGTGIYGPQGGIRPAATRSHSANFRHLFVARAVLSGANRGISKGAERFFDPKAQDALHRKFKRGQGGGRIHSCQALGTLKAWSYDLPKCKGGPGRCCGDGMPPDAQPGPDPDAWVGPIQGVNAFRLMLMAPSSYGSDHDTRFAEAVEVIKSKSGLPAFLDSPVTQLFALLALSRLVGSA